MTSTTTNINNLVQIDESFIDDRYNGDYIICHCDHPILYTETSNHPLYKCKAGEEVKKYAIAVGLDSCDYHEADYDPTLDYDSIDKFVGEAFGETSVIVGYGLEREKVYKVNNITFRLDKQEVDKGTYTTKEFVLKVVP